MKSTLVCLALSLSALAPLATGCATDARPETGTLDLPLEQIGDDGALYHLSAQFLIEGPGGSQTVDATGAEPSVTLALPPGITFVTLLDGWTLSRSTDGGASFTPVSALLGSLNPFGARVLANHADSVAFKFLVRDVTGTLTISFGVVSHPRELAGGIVAETGTAGYTAYARARLDYAIFHDLFAVERVTLPDGSRDLVLTADSVAGEVYNDSIGLISGTVAPALAGGFLQYHLIAHPDGTQSVEGELDAGNNPFSVLTFGPATLSLGNLPLDADGFIVDSFFNEPFVPFTLTTQLDDGEAVLTGQLRFRSIPN